MWRDILIILGFVIAGLTYFGLTPRQMSAYAKSATIEITKRRLYQGVFLFLMIVTTLLFILVTTWRFETIELATLLLAMALLTYVWCIILSDVWKLSERGEKVVDMVTYSLMAPLLIATTVLSDMLLWQKVVYPLGGACIGYGVGILRGHRHKKCAERRSTREVDK
jgi:hypothetical protein